MENKHCQRCFQRPATMEEIDVRNRKRFVCDHCGDASKRAKANKGNHVRTGTQKQS